ncbi:MAG TPA: TonB-dependent receptor [Bacteroidales bacterium]|nr:TonB-dependent receptor [Bacteroidales bacterium]
MQPKNLLQILIPMLILVFSGSLHSQYVENSFNSKGNPCYFNYLRFTKSEDYSQNNRPIIFILGAEKESLTEMFEKDTLKNMVNFFNYLFVYIPNSGGSPEKKLDCIPALASLVTNGFNQGNANLFLYIRDSSIIEKDLSQPYMKLAFRNIIISEKSQKINIDNDTANNVADKFKQTFIEFEQVKHDEDGSVYYYTNENDENEEMQKKSNRRTYFGPPTSFNFTLSGIVKDKSTGESLPFTSVYISGTKIGTTTNSDGFFTLIKVPTDTSTLVIQYIGYEKTEVFLTPSSYKKNILIEMYPSTNMLNTVNVFGQKSEVVLSNKSEISIIKMTPKKLEQLPSLGEKDIMRSFQLMPGVSAANESSSGLYVRGGTPNQNLVLYDGFTIYHVDHLYGFFSAFNSNALKDVQLMKGGFESRFGGRLSSVTEITGKEGNQKKFNMGGDLSLLSINMFAEIPIGDKFTSIITFRRSYKGSVYNAIFKKFNNSTTVSVKRPGGAMGSMMQESNITSYFYDLNGKMTYRPDDKNIYSLSFYNGTDKLDNSISMQMPSFGGDAASDFSMNSTDLTKYGNTGSSLKWSKKWKEKFYSNTIASYSQFFSYRDMSQERTMVDTAGESAQVKQGIFEDNLLKDFSLKSDCQWDIFKSNQLQAGFFATKFDIDYTYAQSDTSIILQKQNLAYLAGVYLQDKIKIFNEKIQILPGVRMSYYDITDKYYQEPRLAMSLNLTDKINLKGSTGKYYQFANRITREDILSGSKEFWIMSDGESVPVSSAIHYNGGITWESPFYLVSSEIYYKTLENLTEYSLRYDNSPTGVSYDENFFTGEGYAKGIEFLFQKKSGLINGWVCYTLGETKNFFEVYSDSYFPANQDVTHELKFVAMAKYKRWDFSLTWIFATGKPYTAPSGAYTVTLLDGSTKDYFTVTGKNSLRLPDYHRGDLSISYKLLSGSQNNFRRKEIGYLSFSVFNFYAHKNVWYKQYSVQDNQIIETNYNYLGFTPNITLSLKIR